MERREYKIYQFVRPLDYTEDVKKLKEILLHSDDSYKGYSKVKKVTKLVVKSTAMEFSKHGYFAFIPDEQSKYFEKDGKLKEKYKHYPEPKKFDDGRLGWTIGAHQDINGNLVVVFNQDQDLYSTQDYFDNGKRTILKSVANNETLRSNKYKTSDELGDAIMEDSMNYKENNNNGIAPKYFGGGFGLGLGYNCNSWTNKIADRQKIINFKKDMKGIDIGDFGEIDDLYFKKIESKSDGKNEKK